jgi:hypothetical protein
MSTQPSIPTRAASISSHTRFRVLLPVRDGYLGFRRELFERDRAAVGRHMEVSEKPYLGTTGTKGEPMTYECSLCGHVFLVRDDLSPKDAAEELVAAFGEHVGTCLGLPWVSFL